jgi:hypothetical protein
MSEYYDWIKAEALKINSDGCSRVLDIHKVCCYEHDLAYFYGRDPQKAYVVGWGLAAKISRSDADEYFKHCNLLMGPSALAWWRWMGVRLGGWNAWRKHRKERP